MEKVVMDLFRKTAFHNRVLLLYQNTQAVRLILDSGAHRLDAATRARLDQVSRQTEEINRRTGAGLFPMSGDEYQSLLDTNERVREIYDRVARARHGEFDEHLSANAAAAWHRDYHVD